MRKLVRGERRLQFALVVALTLLFVTLNIRAWVFSRTDDQLCNVIYSLVARSGATVGKPGTPGYAYYSQHPDELAKARAQNQDFLNELPCR